VVWATGPPSVAFAKQWATAGVHIPLMFTGAQASSLWLKPTAAAAEGLYVASTLSVVATALPAGGLKQAVDQLNDPFTAKYGYPPPQFAGDGFSGMQLLAAAITKANSTAPDKIRQALEGLSLLTPNGMYHYSPTDHAGLDVKYMSINVVKNGAFVPTDWAGTQLAAIANG
jgi:branched-chain amino acid transport system substrate-binding protein